MISRLIHFIDEQIMGRSVTLARVQKSRCLGASRRAGATQITNTNNCLLAARFILTELACGQKLTKLKPTKGPIPKHPDPNKQQSIAMPLAQHQSFRWLGVEGDASVKHKWVRLVVSGTRVKKSARHKAWHKRCVLVWQQSARMQSTRR